MSYIIFGDAFTFPEGDASTNRVFTYAKGLTENTLCVHVICFRNDYLPEYKGVADKIKYYYPYNQVRKSSSFFIRRWFKVIKYFRTIRLVKELNKRKKVIAIHCYTKLLSTQFFAYILSRIINARLILERSEHPLKDYKSKITEKYIGALKVVLESRMCDGIFCISEYLINFYRVRGTPESKLFKIPSTVDANRFTEKISSPLQNSYICYCGSLTLLKDGVDILIKSFSLIADKFPDINLVLIGAADTYNDEIYLRDLGILLGLSQRIIFTGKLSRNQVPAYLTNADILVLARPRSVVAEAGFPSKLTEYLSTGNPVIATRVGEIPIYLEDNVNAFLSEPDNADAFAKKMEYVLCNYEQAQKVGERGKELTRTIFNYNYQTKRVIAFIKTLY